MRRRIFTSNTENTRIFRMQVIIDYLQDMIGVLEVPHIFVLSDEFVYLKFCHIYPETWRPLQALCCTNRQFPSTLNDAESTFYK